MLSKSLTAVALTFFVTSICFAQSNTKDQYLIPGINHSASQTLSDQSTPALPVVTRARTNQPTTTLPGPNYNTPPVPRTPAAPVSKPAVGNSYFNPGSGCDSRGYGGCDAGYAGGCQIGDCAGGCNSGCCGSASYGGCGYGNCGGCGYGCCPDKHDHYARFFGGWNWADDIDFPNQSLSFEDGWGIGLAMGRQVTCNRRRELEVAYRHNSLGNFTVPGTPAFNATGSTKVYSLMGNVIFDLDSIQLGQASLYTGGGFGGAFLDFDGQGLVDEDTALAYQFICGLQRDMRSGAKAFIEYRYFGTTEFNLNGFDETYTAHNVFVGVQLKK